MDIEIKPLAGALGAEIMGVDLAVAPSPALAARIRELLFEHQVLVFRDCPITPLQQRDFAAELGTVEQSLVQHGNLGVPGMIVVESSHAKGLTDEWHTDQPFVQSPPMAAMLHAIEVPSRGGDTLWANMAAAYDALSAPLRTMLDGLTATHNTVRMKRRIAEMGRNFGYSDDGQDHHHPVVRVHPVTGRKALYVCPLYTARIDGLTETESNSLLKLLYDHITSAPFQLRVGWTKGTTVMWDEASTIHYAIADYDEPRRMHRLILEGSEPIAPRLAA
jgi:taurine dioxygenase